MAEIQTAATAPKTGKPMRKRLSTRVDLTPMVDLGFLLITFFIFTTALSTPSVLKLNLPTGEANMPVGEQKVLSLVLGKNNKVGYYMGSDVKAMQMTNYAGSGIREKVQKAQQFVAQRFHNKSLLFVVIKPSAESSYKNVIDALDEMLINNVKQYTLTEASTTEEQLINK